MANNLLSKYIPWLQSYRDNLLPGSFRDVSFATIDTRNSGGRRGTLHEYPGKDDPYYEDNGRKGKVFNFSCFVIQNEANDFDYFEQRDQLIDALDTEGPGTLIHPFRGDLTVAVQTYSWVESFQEMGIARFDIVFVETTEALYPIDESDPTGDIDNAFLDLLDEIADAFGEAWDYVDGALDWVDSTLSMIKNVTNSINGAVSGTINDMQGYIAGLLSSVSTILDSPCQLINTIQNAQDKLTDLVGMGEETLQTGILGGCSAQLSDDSQTLNGTSIPSDLGRSVLNAGLSLTTLGDASEFGGSFPTIPGDSSTRQQERISQEALQYAGRILAIGNVSRIAARIDYESRQDALEILESIADSIDDQLDLLGGDLEGNFDKYFTSLQKLRAVVVPALREIGAGLADIDLYTVPAGPLSTLELAYDKYEDLNRCSEIFNRNRPTVHHPGFLPGGEVIELLEK